MRHLWAAQRARTAPRPLGPRAGSPRASGRGAAPLQLARPWNPLRAFGPRLQPIVHVGDEEALRRARAIVEVLLPKDGEGTRAAGRQLLRQAAAAAKRLGGVYHAERFWLFLPSGDGLPEAQHPLEMAEA